MVTTLDSTATRYDRLIERLLVVTGLQSTPPPTVVRVLGVPAVPKRPRLDGPRLRLTVFLACQDGPVSIGAVRHAVWNGKAVKDKTLWNVVTETRDTFGPLDGGEPIVRKRGRGTERMGFAGGVITDLGLLQSAFRSSLDLSPLGAVGLLGDALGLVGGPPFDAKGYDWAHHDGVATMASMAIEDVVCQLAGLALDSVDLNLARHSVIRGLRCLPGDEVLYRLLMRVEHGAGNIAAVHTAYSGLCRYLAGLDVDARPARVTTDLYRQLASGG